MPVPYIPPAGLPNRTAALPRLPPRLSAADECEQALLEIGGALCALRRRGLAWIVIARAVDLPLAEVRVLARLYAERAVAEAFRDASD
jgi:hypothetical protein